MDKVKVGAGLLVAAVIDTVLIHLTTWRLKGTSWPWVFSLLLPILVLVGVLLLGRGLGERKEWVYDYRHGSAPDSERTQR
ncbi:MAG TPA: hypothetical protein VMW22_01275 [Candidatus Desulfaltia sp.]|nr:hypothetical protein [Candidatus Desulfaltia sp.]